MHIDLKHIRNHYKNDHFATNSDIVIDSVTEDCVICSMELSEKHKNAVGGIQGGAIFTLADLAFAVHCNLAMVCGEDVCMTVGQSCNITYLKSTKGSRLISKSTCLSKGNKVSVYRICIEDDMGVQIAVMMANSFTLAKR